MTTYTADLEAAGVQPVQNATGDVTRVAIFALTAAFGLNDLVKMLTLPANAYVVDVVIGTDAALDTNATSTISYDVGDSNAAQRYIAAKAQGNNVPLPPYHMDQAAGLGYQIGTNTGDNVVVVKIHAAPATGATSGNLRVAVTYGFQTRTPTTDTND